MSEHEWLTVEELAERYRRSAHTIRRWLRDGKFGELAEKTPAGGWLVRADAGKPDGKTGTKGFKVLMDFPRKPL